jgi:hypothetical protein
VNGSQERVELPLLLVSYAHQHLLGAREEAGEA